MGSVEDPFFEISGAGSSGTSQVRKKKKKSKRTSSKRAENKGSSLFDDEPSKPKSRSRREDTDEVPVQKVRKKKSRVSGSSKKGTKSKRSPRSTEDEGMERRSPPDFHDSFDFVREGTNTKSARSRKRSPQGPRGSTTVANLAALMGETNNAGGEEHEPSSVIGTTKTVSESLTTGVAKRRGSNDPFGASRSSIGSDVSDTKVGAVAIIGATPGMKDRFGSSRSSLSMSSANSHDQKVGAMAVAGPPPGDKGGRKMRGRGASSNGRGGQTASAFETSRSSIGSDVSDSRVGAVPVVGGAQSAKGGGKGSSRKPGTGGPSLAETRENYESRSNDAARVGAMSVRGGSQTGKNRGVPSLAPASESYDGNGAPQVGAMSVAKPAPRGKASRGSMGSMGSAGDRETRVRPRRGSADHSITSIASSNTGVGVVSVSERAPNHGSNPRGRDQKERTGRGTMSYFNSADPYQPQPSPREARATMMENSISGSFTSIGSERSGASQYSHRSRFDRSMNQNMGMNMSISQTNDLHSVSASIADDQSVGSHQPHVGSNISDTFGDTDDEKRQSKDFGDESDDLEANPRNRHSQNPPPANGAQAAVQGQERYPGHDSQQYSASNSDIQVATVSIAAPQEASNRSATNTAGLVPSQYDPEFGDGPIIDAPVSADLLTMKTEYPWYRSWWAVGVACVVLTGAVIGVSIPLALGGSGGPTPTMAPTQEPLDPVRIAVIREVLSDVTDAEQLDDVASPQNAAFNWVLREDEMTPLENGELSPKIRFKVVSRYVLATIFHATDGDGWFKSDGWLQADLEECEWQHVSCIGEEVISLDTGDRNNLRGQIPSEIRELKALRSINLPNNNIDSIHGDFGMLPKLVDLDLSSNNIDGPIPPSLYNLESLRTLNLGNNRLTGSISPEISNLSILRLLFLDRNSLLSGTLTTELHGLTELRDLDLSLCSFKGRWNQVVEPLVKLEIMALGDNDFTGTLGADITRYPSLEQLDLGATALRSQIPPEIGDLVSMNSIFLYRCQLRGTIPTELGNLRRMDEIFLEDNDLVGAVPLEMCEIGVLAEIRVDCGVTCQCAACEVSTCS